MITLGHTKILKQFHNSQKKEKHFTCWKLNAMFTTDGIIFDLNILAFN